MTDDKEVTTPDDPKVSMMYWHERAMAAEAALASERAKQAEPKFAHVYCSQCDGEFGPGNHGYSDCKDHAAQVDPVAFGHDGKPWPHTIDAKAWADEFCKRNTAIDHGTMIGWFANAIEFARAHDAAHPAVQSEPVAFVITDEKINFLQVNSIKRFIERAKHAHFTDIYYRINGKDEVVQADWLKHLQLAAPPADDEAVRLLEETLRPGAYGIGSTLASRIDAYLAKVGKTNAINDKEQ